MRRGRIRHDLGWPSVVVLLAIAAAALFEAHRFIDALVKFDGILDDLVHQR